MRLAALAGDLREEDDHEHLPELLTQYRNRGRVNGAETHRQAGEVGDRTFPQPRYLPGSDLLRQ